MTVATIAATVAWQKLLVCGLPGTFTGPTVVRYGDMPLVQISGKALNCNLIRTAGANPNAVGRGSAVSGMASDRAGSCFPHERRRARRAAARSTALLGEQRAHRFFVGDPGHRLGKKLGAGKLPYAFARPRFIGKRNGVGDDDFIELRFGDALH